MLCSAMRGDNLVPFAAPAEPERRGCERQSPNRRGQKFPHTEQPTAIPPARKYQYRSHLGDSRPPADSWHERTVLAPQPYVRNTT